MPKCVQAIMRSRKGRQIIGKTVLSGKDCYKNVFLFLDRWLSVFRNNSSGVGRPVRYKIGDLQFRSGGCRMMSAE